MFENKNEEMTIMKRLSLNYTDCHFTSPKSESKSIFLLVIFVSVYHISFKTYEDHDIERQIELVYLTVIDVSTIFFIPKWDLEYWKYICDTIGSTEVHIMPDLAF